MALESLPLAQWNKLCVYIGAHKLLIILLFVAASFPFKHFFLSATWCEWKVILQPVAFPGCH